MKKFLAAIALAFMLLIGDGGSSFTQAANCPKGASVAEMLVNLEKSEENYGVASDKALRAYEGAIGLRKGMLSHAMIVRLKDGKGIMHMAFMSACLVPQSVFHFTNEQWKEYLGRVDLNETEYGKTGGSDA